MKSLWKPVVLLAFAAFGAGGCAPQTTPELVRGVAASYVAGRAFDRAQNAILREDSAGLERAGADLRRAAAAGSNPRLAGALATNLMFEAVTLSSRSERESGAEKYRLEESSNAKYRAALAFTPQENPEKSLDPFALNALGYFLADKGSTPADFERAVILTRAAYRNWDIKGAAPGAGEISRALGPQDSYSWALFRAGKVDEARREAEKVWALARGLDRSTLTAEIPFHLAEIYYALGKTKRAREIYEATLLLRPNETLRILIDRRLKSMDLALV